MNKNLIAISIGGLFLASGFLFYQNGAAYSDETTHPDLTREIITFYELSTGKKFTDEQKQWVIQGSRDEDKAPRWLNHFYDPIFERGLQTHTVGINGYLAKHWAQFSSYQTVNPKNVGNLWTANGPVISGSWWGDFSYEAAIKDYSKDKEKEAYVALGHVLHLIEDVTVPEHTRNDPHPGGPQLSYYENWTKNNSSGLTQDLGKRIYNQGHKPVIYANLESYFNNLATYTNTHFFSPRTIKSDIYQKPKIVFEDGTFAYGIDEKGAYFDLATIVTDRKSGNKSYALDDSHNQVLQEYWLRLSRQAVINGAGVIQLFLNQAGAAKDAELARQKIEQINQPKSSLMGQIYGFFTNPGSGNQPALTITSEPTPNAPRIIKTTPINSQSVKSKTTQKTESIAQAPVKTPKPVPAPVVTPTPPPPAVSTPVPTPAPQTSAPVVYGGGGGGGGSSSNSSSNNQQTAQNSTSENIEISTFQAGDLVINEIMYDLGGDLGDTDTNREWIELYNNSSAEIDVTGWKFNDGDNATNHGLNVPPENNSQGSMILPAGGYAVLAEHAETFLADHSGFAGTVIDTAEMNLKNSSSTVTTLKIIAPDGAVIDEVTYYNSWGANGDGKTLERKSATDGSSNPTNWGVSSAIGGTPGVLNNWELSTSDVDNSASTTLAMATSTPVLGLGTDVPATTTITTNITWSLSGSPYRLFFSQFQRPTVMPGATLTIEPGVKIIPQSGGGATALEIQGALQAIATSGAPIIFTSINDADDLASTTPQKGDWLNVIFTAGSQGNLDYVEFRYGGYGFELPFKEMVKITGAAVNINNSKFENSQNTALHLVDANVTVENSVFTDNRCGISVDSALDIAIAADGSCFGYHSSISRAAATTTPQIRNNQFIRNQAVGIEIRNGATPVIDGNIFTDNGYPARIESAYPAITNSQIVNSTTSPNILNGIAISGRTHFTQNHTLKKDLPYILETNGPGLMPYVDKGGTLTIEPGVIFKTGNPNSVLSIGCVGCYSDCVNCEGHLIVQGTAENPVVFTSIKDDARGGDTNGDGSTSSPQDGDWGNIRFNASSTGTFANTNFYYGGYGSPPAVIATNSQLLIDVPDTQGQILGHRCKDINNNYLMPDHNGIFANVILHNWTIRNASSSNLDFRMLEAPADTINFVEIGRYTLINPQYPPNAEIDLDFSGLPFTADKRYRYLATIADGQNFPENGCDWGANELYSAGAFYESIATPVTNPALSIDSGATVVIQ